MAMEWKEVPGAKSLLEASEAGAPAKTRSSPGLGAALPTQFWGLDQLASGEGRPAAAAAPVQTSVAGARRLSRASRNRGVLRLRRDAERRVGRGMRDSRATRRCRADSMGRVLVWVLRRSP